MTPSNVDAKTISPEPHAPAIRLLDGTSQTGAGDPPFRSTRFSRPSAKNPIVRPSGDQNSADAPSVPGTGRASRSESARIHTLIVGRLTGATSRDGPDGSARNASREPSGEKAEPTLSNLEQKVGFARGR